jgi:hypothetical protein
MELKFVAAKKPETGDPIVQRRHRLVRRLDQQISLMKSNMDATPLNCRRACLPSSAIVSRM